MSKGILPMVLLIVLLMVGCERRQDPPPEPVPPTTPTPTTTFSLAMAAVDRYNPRHLAPGRIYT